MFADVPPSVLVWLAARGTQRPFTAGELVLEEGSPSDHLALVLSGDVRVQLSAEERVTLGPGHVVGEIGVITDHPRTATVMAGPEGCSLFLLPSPAFEDLLRRSDAFSRSLLAQLAQRLAETTRRLPDPLHGS
jgi:CRP-like cAMP-binding protein